MEDPRSTPKARTMIVHALLIGALLASSATCNAAVVRHVPTHDDVWLMKRLGEPQASPDGRWLVLPVTEPSYDEGSQLTDLWLVDTSAQTPPRRLTSSRRAENDVTWSPDSRRIAFSTQREGDVAPQIYLLDLVAPGDARPVTHLSGGALSPAFSRDGRLLAFVSMMYPGAQDEKANLARIAAARDRKSNARIYDGFPVRHWDRWVDELQPRVFVQPLDADGFASGAPRDLLAGTRLAANAGYAGRLTDTGEEMSLEFSPDGKSLVFVASTNRDQAAHAFTDAQLFAVDVNGGEPRALTSGHASWSLPHFTPDGKLLLALREERNSFVYNEARLCALAWPNAGDVRVVTSNLDRAVINFAVTPDSRTVYFTAEDAGNVKLYSVSLAGGAVKTLFGVGTGSYAAPVIPANRRGLALYAIWESSSVPAEVVQVNPENGTPVTLTRFNLARGAQLELPAIESFWFTSSRGKRIQSFVVRPPRFDPSRKYPLFVVIHGGPHNEWSDQFLFRWNYHLLAAPGYVLLLTNYSGSTGFGEQFARSIQGDPFKGPADELNEAADAAIRQFSFIDGNRQCAGGASYGGHLANWLQASTTRYKCLISHAGLVNLESQWGTSDTIYMREVNLGGPPWEKGAVWSEQNPIRYAANFHTPTLVTVGENDFRVPMNNALEYWSALQRMQVPSRLVVFPDANHWILKGEDSRLFYSEVAAWLDRWLQPGR